MKKTSSNYYSRRSFIATSFMGMAGVSLLPLKSCAKASDTINLGFIGLGRQTMFLMGSFMKIDGVRVLAGADVYAIKRDRFIQRAEKYYQEAEINQKVDIYEDYRKILERKDIDAVVIASPDHWHAIMAIEACNAGKDVYLEKPLTLTIKEGEELVKAVRRNNIILAVGSQQRSDENFIYVKDLVRNGKIGTLEKLNVYVGTPPHPLPYTLPEEPIPAGLNWERWLGPLPNYHFNKELNPPISLDPPANEEFWGGWRWYKEFGGGFMTDWGAHMIDIAHWGMDMDKGGPTRIIPAGQEDAEFLTYQYANDVQLTIQPFNEKIQGVKFWGSDGWIEISRGRFDTSIEELRPEVNKDDVPYEGRSKHHLNFIESIKSRQDPVVPVEIGHNSCVACTLGNIAYELNRPLDWNPATETFLNDPEADKYLHYNYREGYKL